MTKSWTRCALESVQLDPSLLWNIFDPPQLRRRLSLILLFLLSLVSFQSIPHQIHEEKTRYFLVVTTNMLVMASSSSSLRSWIPVNNSFLMRNDASPTPPQQLSGNNNINFLRKQPNARSYTQAIAESNHTTPPTSESRPRRLSIVGRQNAGKSVVKRVWIDFRRLPYTVFQCILDQLLLLHTEGRSPTCSTCQMRDLAAMQLVCSAWDADTRRRLYEHIRISGPDSQAQLRTQGLKRGSRLKLLRRTLRGRRLLASLVKTLDVPDPNLLLYLRDGSPNPDFEEYRDLVASIVMLCPNLEQLTGFYTVYNHDFDRLTHALSTRRNLKEHVWIIGENDEITARSERQLAPGLIDNHQRYQFLHYHQSWQHLECLALCSPGGSGVIEHGIFAEMLSSLPALKHLCVSSFDSDDFTDLTLNFLPDLTSLRIEECFGVTGTGLARWSASPSANRLRILSLIHQNIRDLTKISKILASLGSLQKFVMVQSDVSPKVLGPETVFQPLLASLSLEELHWDIAPEKIDLENPMSILDDQDDPENRQAGAHGEDLTPNTHLALSIVHSGFPRLRNLRAPRDVAPLGILQAVCLPSETRNVLLPSDKSRDRPNASVLQTNIPRTNSLRAARLRAQGYIDGNISNARLLPSAAVTDYSDPSDDSVGNTTPSDTSGSTVDTNMTEPDGLYSPVGHPAPAKRGMLIRPSNPPASHDQPLAVELECPYSESLLTYNHTTFATPQLPCRSPKRTTSVPAKTADFSLSSFVGRVVATGSQVAQPPRFRLTPDLPGRDGNGGIIGWGDLLRVGEKSAAAQSAMGNNNWSAQSPVAGAAMIKDGCSGAWGRDGGKEQRWWRHTMRERRRWEEVVRVEHFF